MGQGSGPVKSASMRHTGMRMLGELMQMRIDGVVGEDNSLDSAEKSSRLAAHRPQLSRTRSRSKSLGLPGSCDLTGSLQLDESQSDILKFGSLSRLDTHPEIYERKLPPIRLYSLPSVTESMSTQIEGDPTTDRTLGIGEGACPSKVKKRLTTLFEQLSRLQRRLRSKCMPGCLLIDVDTSGLEEPTCCSIPQKCRDTFEVKGTGQSMVEEFAAAAERKARLGAPRSKKHHRTASMRMRCNMIEEHFLEIHGQKKVPKAHRRCLSLDDAVVYMVVSPNGGTSSVRKNLMDSMLWHNGGPDASLGASPPQHMLDKRMQIKSQ